MRTDATAGSIFPAIDIDQAMILRRDSPARIARADRDRSHDLSTACARDRAAPAWVQYPSPRAVVAAPVAGARG